MVYLPRNSFVFAAIFGAVSIAYALPQHKAKHLTLGAQLLELDDAWSHTAAAHKLDATVAFYSDDAVMLAPNEPIRTTKQAIRKSWTPFCDPTTKIAWKATKVEIAKAKDVAYMYGFYNLTVQENGKAISDKGKFLEIWKKQRDGKWKCAVDMFNSDLPAAG